MATQITFWELSRVDLSRPNVDITVTDAVASETGESIADRMRNRKNTSGWITTDSTDAANTTLEIDWTDSSPITDIILVKHNLKAFTIKYDDSGWTDFSTPISETTNTEETNRYEFTEVTTTKIQIVITGTQTADADKKIAQLIITKKLGNGNIESYPEIKKPTISTNRKVNKMLSGKSNVISGLGGLQCSLALKAWHSDSDFDAFEELYFGLNPVLMNFSGVNDSQFPSRRIGYRNEDFYVVRPRNEYIPEWVGGVYKNLKIKLDLVEVTV